VARLRFDPVAAPARTVHPRAVGDGLTRGLARGAGWTTTSHGLFVPAGIDRDSPQQRVVEVAARMPKDAAITGWAACLLAGAAWCDGLAPDGVTPLPVPVVVGPRGGMRRGPDVRVSFERLPEWEVWTRYGVRVVRPERAVFDEMRAVGQREALVVLEAALAARITSLSRMTACVESHRPARRSARARWAVARARGHVRSPLEVRVRTVAEEDAGWWRTEVNRVVVQDGRRLGEVDIIEVESGAVIEVDGADHRTACQQAWDITKEERLRAAGIEVTRVTAAHLRDADALAERLRAVRRRAHVDSGTRAWTLTPRAADAEDWLAEREALAVWDDHIAEHG
jgi:very-short-patch-repair endonuclease